MVIEREYYVQLSQIGKENKITNKSLLGIFEDIGGVHSNIAGYGIPTMDKTHLTWVLLDWKVQIIRRPVYAEKILVRTWSRHSLKFYAFRDFEVLDEQGNVVSEYSDYVPKCMCPKENGYGDYIIMDIDKDGYINGWNGILVEKMLN